MNPDFLRDAANFTIHTIAMICNSCDGHIKSKRRPPFSIASGKDLGRASIQQADSAIPTDLPILGIRPLSLLEKMCIVCIRIYYVSVKFVSVSTGAIFQFGITGHAVAVPTSAAQLVAERAQSISSLPRLDVHTTSALTVTFIGSLDKWTTLINGQTGRALKATYSNIFSGIFL